MVDFKSLLNTDHFKIGHFGDKHVKRINLLLLISGIVIIITIIFYIIMFSFTNFSALDDLEDYSEEYKAEDKVLSDINLAAKIMPSYNYAKNAIWMEKTRDVNDTIIPNAEEMMIDLNLNNTYLKIENTKYFFPKFKFKETNIPIGNSISMCVSLHWATFDKGQNFDLTTQVLNFPQCKEAVSGKFMWNDDDPKTGIDVPVWTQHEKEIDCTDQEDCESSCKEFNAIYLNGRKGKKCYSYKILESICLSIKWDDNLQSFSYKGGCFANGIHYQMREPVIGETYHFDDIKFEVRNADDPVIKAGEMSNFTYSYGASFNIFSIILNVFFFVALGVFLSCIGMIYYYKHQNKQEAPLNKDHEDNHDEEMSNKDDI